MSDRRLLWLALLAPLGVSVPAAAGPLEIVPQTFDCVVADGFPRIEAVVTPIDQVSLVRVLFRTGYYSLGWYWVRMDVEGDHFVAVLPKPKKQLKDFRYYIEATDAQSETSRTPEYKPDVIAHPGACHGTALAKTVASAKVITHVPGGPEAPRVPDGFSASGTLRAGEEGIGVFPGLSPGHSLLAMGALGAALTGTTLVIVNHNASAPQGSVTLLSSSPPPGSTLSLSRDSLAMTLSIITPQDVRSSPVQLGLLPSRSPGSLNSSTDSCVTFVSPALSFTAGTPQTATIGGPLSSSSLSPLCQSAFSAVDVTNGTVTVQGDQGRFSLVFPVDYHFVP